MVPSVRRTEVCLALFLKSQIHRGDQMPAAQIPEGGKRKKEMQEQYQGFERRAESKEEVDTAA